MPDLILASASPRRRELLQQIGLDFTIKVSNVEEVLDQQLDYGAMVERLAYQKARHVAETVNEGIVLGADTLVVQGNTIMGKPADPTEAAGMLRQLSGTSHQVLTGISLIDAKTGIETTNHEITTVYFRDLTDTEIARYIDYGEYRDKAGAYAIQGLASIFVLGIEGCYFNVVGLPLVRLSIMLREYGIEVL